MELLQYTFFQHALIGSLLASIACGLIGTYIVTRRLVFISGGLTHASFGGIGLGLYTGISPILSAALFAVLSAFGVEWLSKRKDMREDSAIAVFWTLGMALGIMFTFLSPGFAPDLSAYLFGNILTITWSDIALLGGLALLLILFFALYLHPIIYVAFDREFARSQGIPVQVFEYVLMMFIALTIVACLRMVGIVLVISLLTVPQMTANLFSHRFHRIIWLSIGIGYLSCLGGLMISFYLNVPSGASIIFFSIIILNGILHNNFTVCSLSILIPLFFFYRLSVLVFFSNYNKAAFFNLYGFSVIFVLSLTDNLLIVNLLVRVSYLIIHIVFVLRHIRLFRLFSLSILVRYNVCLCHI